MQKKVIALAVAGILAVPMAAQAGVEVYGQARLSAGLIGNDDTTTSKEDSKMAVSSHASRLGFKGAEDLGDGLKAVWQIERSVDFSDKDTTLGVRNTFAGLAGGFGTVLLGAHDTPYKIATGSLDPFADTFADYNAVVDATNDARSKNVLAYISPDMSGFTVAAALVTDFADDNLVDTTDSTALPGGTTREQGAISLAGMYKNGPLDVSLAYQSVSETGAAVGTKYDDLAAVKLGAGYAVTAATKLGFVYENVDFGGNDNDQSNLYLSAAHGLGNGLTVKAAFGQKDDVGNTADSGATFFALGVNKALSDKTEVYALYTKIDSDKNAAAYGLGVGNQSIGAAGAEPSASALAAGINIKFSSM